MERTPLVPRNRLNTKTSSSTLQAHQQPVIGWMLGEEAPEGSKLMAYMITLPFPKQMRTGDGVLLVPSSEFTKTELAAKIKDAFQHPDSHNPAQALPSPIELQRFGIWREWHVEDENGIKHQHDHVPILTYGSFRYLAVKRALLLRHGFASHWSRHTGYWSMVRYLAMPSPKKPLQSLDPWPLLWDSSGVHPALTDSCYAPVTGSALTARRHLAAQKAAEKGKSDPRVTDLDIWALVVRAGLRNTADDRQAHLRLAAHAKAHCGEAVVHYLWKKRHQLPAMIDDIWLWENIEEAAKAAQMSRKEAVEVAAAATCSCSGAWKTFVSKSFTENRIDSRQLCRDIWDALHNGRSETTPVVVLAGLKGGEGKSAFLKPMHSLFPSDKAVFNVTRECGNFPLLDLPNAKVVFLDDFRFDPDVLSWGSTCLWFDGSDLPIGRPQNVQGVTGNMVYKGSAPIFITTKLDDLVCLEAQAAADPETGVPVDANAAMLRRRLNVYKFHTRVSKPPARFKFCARCFVDFLRDHVDGEIM